MTDFTVAIPTFNGENRLRCVLESLNNQIIPKDITWEVLVIDNNSQDNTKVVVLDFQEIWLLNKKQLKYCFEPRQGAAFARLRAIQEANSNLVGFLDDDTIPEVDWLKTAFHFAKEHPAAGAYGSRISAIFDGETPQNFDRVKVFLAIIERGECPHQYTRKKKMLPPSAGLVVRREAWLQCVPKVPFLSGRTSESILTGEDTEMLAHLQMAGWEIWHNPNMQIYHKIPYSRLERKYLLPMVKGIGLTRHHIRMIRTPTLIRPLFIPAYFMGDLWKVLEHIVIHKGNYSDLVSACEITFLLATLCSPFYMLVLYFKRRAKL